VIYALSSNIHQGCYMFYSIVFKIVF